MMVVTVQMMIIILALEAVVLKLNVRHLLNKEDKRAPLNNHFIDAPVSLESSINR
jgi:hypothetical protein